MMHITGIVWAGPVGDMGGYGNVSRNFLRSIEKLNIPISIYNTAGFYSNEIGEDEIAWLNNLNKPISDLGEHVVLMIHDLPINFGMFSNQTFIKRIGLTIFETDRIPDLWKPYLNLVDEIWVPSEFNIKTFSLSGVPNEKLILMPYGIDTTALKTNQGIYCFPPEVNSFKFLYVCAFDYRKGLDLLVSSYCKEFSSNDDITLILKLYIPQWQREVNVIQYLRSLVPNRKNNPHIFLIVDSASRAELLSLYSSADCYISTDRANGWGMPVMEMMALGKPTMSINWSGSTQFMNSENSFLLEPEPELEEVSPRLSAARPELYSGHKWAVVKEETVRKGMREAYVNRSKGTELGRRAKKDMEEFFSLQKISEYIKDKFDL
jgi:glycosyltransferase involved in cell wall biosynthesis